MATLSGKALKVVVINESMVTALQTLGVLNKEHSYEVEYNNLAGTVSLRSKRERAFGKDFHCVEDLLDHCIKATRVTKTLRGHG